MGVQAYILIQSEIGSSEAVVLATRAVPGVLESFEVTGPYDVIVRAEAPSVDDLGRLVVSQIQQIEGITRTVTCPVVTRVTTRSAICAGSASTAPASRRETSRPSGW